MLYEYSMFSYCSFVFQFVITNMFCAAKITVSRLKIGWMFLNSHCSSYEVGIYNFVLEFQPMISWDEYFSKLIPFITEPTVVKIDPEQLLFCAACF